LVSDGLVSSSPAGPLVLPQFLGEHDHPWLHVLLEEHERFIGRPQRELDARLREPLPCASPPAKLRLAVQVLARLQRSRRPRSAVPPRRARELVFQAAARADSAPPLVLAEVAADLGVTARDLSDSLFADLPGERLVEPASVPLSPGDLALHINLALVQALLSHASKVLIDVEGQTRALVRHARLRGLICTVTERTGLDDVCLEISGPFALFRRTGLYGRALGQIVPMLAWCARFRLRAECVLHGRPRTLQLRTGDPLFPGGAPRRHDSRIEERFAREFRKVAPEWDVVREPEPINADGTLIFPDFALQRRADPARRWLLEIVGFWTPDYVARKLAHYRRARLSNLILCIDEERNCANADLPANARLVRFRRRVNPAAILEQIDA
jgi:predicted nuclease of restriction endonuclease-like RecB superfamily